MTKTVKQQQQHNNSNSCHFPSSLASMSTLVKVAFCVTKTIMFKKRSKLCDTLGCQTRSQNVIGCDPVQRFKLKNTSCWLKPIMFYPTHTCVNFFGKLAEDQSFFVLKKLNQLGAPTLWCFSLQPIMFYPTHTCRCQKSSGHFVFADLPEHTTTRASRRLRL